MSTADEVKEHDCFTDPQSLEEQEDDRPNVVVRVCTVCGRRHIEMVAEPGDFRAEAP